MHLQLTPVAGTDERAGYPSASEYSRLLKCRASFLMAKRAKALGQVAHERSPASDLGTKLHLANIEGRDILTPEEREDWEICQESELRSSSNGPMTALCQSRSSKSSAYGCARVSGPF